MESVREVPQTAIWVAAHLATYLAGAAVVLRRRGGRAGRRLLGLGTALLMVTAVALVATADGRAPGWAEVALIQALDLAVPATLLALLAVYPDGEYRAVLRAERGPRGRRTARAVSGGAADRRSPGCRSRSALTWLDQSGYRAPSSPLYVPVLEPLGAVVARRRSRTRSTCIVFGAVGLFALRYRRDDAAERDGRSRGPCSPSCLLALTGAVDQLLWVAGAYVTVVGWASGRA